MHEELLTTVKKGDIRVTDAIALKHTCPSTARRYRQTKSARWRSPMLDHTLIQAFAKDLEPVCCKVGELSMGASGTHLVVSLLPSDDGIGVSIDVIEALPLGVHNLTVTLKLLFE
ncbi:MAG: hypothetical protein P0Y58_18260 [Candidatus Pseudomonas phytovorans]|uniref:Uncharacterized protein n=1 Tax=Candidatus Pseudomonas phytovorans TaxID=3121377 RepID=A0AAJ6B8Y5_9PSED|nr:hypothetical protein [Pseudomonas sp.]WEK28850.1 MAG: hypothetical protein P0Y58_18260 [Pseudomonas sp.]